LLHTALQITAVTETIFSPAHRFFFLSCEEEEEQIRYIAHENFLFLLKPATAVFNTI
jgi:hypothetical protein